ncbi:hypothetical protein ANN_11625 [Periplaneta americana]|uniref:Endonuclease/exonuclease/phosphatase domain-containing protein n=1 Tax=Periplaneta americana TaxID=6978 RepID=A0ABQ8T798_PERAM|nr:hypothetical protein ANN_11625 [Periplaneta americana]
MRAYVRVGMNVRVLKCHFREVGYRYQNLGKVENRPIPGRPRISSLEEDAVLFETVRQDSFLTAKEIRAVSNFPGSSQTVISRLRNRGIRSRRAAQMEILGEAQAVDRLAFATNRVDFDWRNVIFSDETTISSDYEGPVRVYREDGLRHDQRYVHRRERSGRFSISKCGTCKKGPECEAEVTGGQEGRSDATRTGNICPGVELTDEGMCGLCLRVVSKMTPSQVRKRDDLVYVRELSVNAGIHEGRAAKGKLRDRTSTAGIRSGIGTGIRCGLADKLSVRRAENPGSGPGAREDFSLFYLLTHNMGGPPAWGLGEGLTTHHRKKQLVTYPYNKPRNRTDSLARPQQRNKDLRFGTWNVTSLYRTGGVTLVAKELARYRIDFVGVQEVRLDGNGISQIGDYLLYYGEGNNNHQLGTGFFVHKRIKSAVKKVEFISDRLSYLVLKGRWCDIIVINAHAPTEEKDDHIKNSFYEELEHTFDQFPRYHMKILLGDFNAKVGREDIFRPTIGKESLHAISSDNGVRLVNFATSKNLIVKSTTFPHKDIHKYTWTSPDGLTHNQIDHILIDKRRHTSIVDIRTFRGADCNSDHYLVIGELRERLSVAKRVEQEVNITKFNILKLKDEEAKQNYQVEISNRFATLESSDEVEKELDVNSVWENIRDSIKIAAEQSIGYYETKKKKPWFDEDCCMVVKRRKQAKLKFLQDPVEEKRDNYFNERREASRTLRNKKRGYLKEKLNEVETNSKNKNIRDLYKGIKEFKNGYQPRVNVIKDENGDLLADSPSILNRWKNYFAQLLNVHRPNRNDRDEIEIQTAEPFIPEPTLSEVEIAIENLKKYKSPGIDQIPAELIQEGGSALYSEIYKLVLAIWEKEIVPEQWKESIIVPIFKKGDKTNCGNFRGISLLLTSYKILSNILLRRLAPYVDEIIGDHQCGFRRNRSTIDQIFVFDR